MIIVEVRGPMLVKEFPNNRRAFSALVIVLMIILMAVGCGGGETDASKGSDSPAAASIAKKAPTLPAPSSIKSDKDDVLAITAEELVRGITKNSVKENIKEYFGKYADITGEVMSISKGRDRPIIELVLEGNNGDSEIAYVMCVITDYDEAAIDKISEGQSVTITGKITAMSEVPGDGMVPFFTEKTFQAQIIKQCSMR